MSVSDKHKDYVKNYSRWGIVRDCVEGSSAIKKARSSYDETNVEGSNTGVGLYNVEGSKYLPPPNPSDNSLDNIDRYRSYKARASFVNFTGQTKEGFMGMVNRQEPIIKLDANIEYLEENADGNGLGLKDVIKRTISEVMETGFYGILVDYPKAPEGQKTQENTKELKAYNKLYCAESIINWRYTNINGKNVLSLVVLEESIDVVDADGFGSTEEKQYRVLCLIDNIYYQKMYNNDGVLLDEIKMPLKFDGTKWNYIPFQFVGTIDNNSTPDKSVLYDIAELNIAHYRNSADFEESCFIVGQPTPVITGLTRAWVKDILEDGVQIGSRTAMLLPVGASASLLQASSNSMPTEGMNNKEAQMVKIGAKIISDTSGGVETAETAKIRFAGQNSKLGSVVSNVESAIEKCLYWCSIFMGGNPENNEIEINKQFYDATVNPQLIIAKIQLMDRGVIGISDVRTSLRKSGLIDADKTDEEIDAEIIGIDPLA
jgi:hypothetical protein